MAVYFDYKILPYYEDSQCNLTTWHSSFSLLAVAYSKGSMGYVALYLDEVCCYFIIVLLNVKGNTNLATINK